MLGAGLDTTAVDTDLHRGHSQLLGYPRHRYRRGRDQPVRHKPQPWQRAQRDRQAQPIGRTRPRPGSIDSEPLRHGVSWTGVGVLAIASIILVTAGTYRFNHRDLA